MRITWQAVVALLTNQSDERFRDHVFNLLKYILLLSSQRKGCPITDEIASSLFSLLFEQPILFSDKLGLDHIPFLKVNQFKCLSPKAIFVLWEESIRHSNLHTGVQLHKAMRYYKFPKIFQSITKIFFQLFNGNEMLMQAMINSGLCTTVVSILRRIASLPPITTDLIHVSATTPFMECWFGIVRRIVRLCLSYRNSHLYSMCQEMLWLLEMALLNVDIQSERIIRQGLTYVYGVWLTVLQELYLSNGKSNWDSMSDLLAADEESAHDVVDNEIQSDIAPTSNFLSETLSAVVGTIADFRGCIFPILRCSKCLPPIDEYAERLIFCVTEISQFFTSVPVKSLKAVTNQEIKLFKIFLSFLSLNDTRIVTFEHLNNKQRLMNICGERIGYLFSPLIAFVLSPPSTKASKLSFTTSNTGRNVGEQLEMKKRLMIVKTLVSKNNHLKSLLDHLKANLISFEIFLKYLNISY
ncbi:unnamed protein product [Wuchereria bancrofti]|uniref:Uncharacterized protein n=1 Tax=Wuchereria bancrofti TaxID=6293 RepID=A0A3P7E4I2_WUCBA|nr:unnamed protein product [Wuchereria bancrofti]